VYILAFQGTGVNVLYDLPGGKWSFGIGGVYGGLNDIPRFSASNFFMNQESINLRWLYALNVKGRYFFGENNEGFYVQTLVPNGFSATEVKERTESHFQYSFSVNPVSSVAHQV
jgi:hypothetical protein